VAINRHIFIEKTLVFNDFLLIAKYIQVVEVLQVQVAVQVLLHLMALQVVEVWLVQVQEVLLNNSVTGGAGADTNNVAIGTTTGGVAVQ
jgi:hypothetical protein